MRTYQIILLGIIWSGSMRKDVNSEWFDVCGTKDGSQWVCVSADKWEPILNNAMLDSKRVAMLYQGRIYNPAYRGL